MTTREGWLNQVSFGACVNVVNQIESEQVKRLAISDMREALADKIVRTKMEVTKKEFTTEYRLQVYVLTPEEFGKVVNDKVQELSHIHYLKREDVK